MSTGIWSAASGAVGQTAALDVAADNIANATTPGFRSERAVFRQTLVSAVDRTRGTESMRYSVARANVPDFTMGALSQSGKPLDAAFVDGNGFFVVSTANGERYTRAGSFRLTAQGTLVTPDGSTVLGENRKPIQVDPSQGDFRLDGQGQILSGGEPVGKLLTVRFNEVNALEKEGHILLRARPEAGAATAFDAQLEPGTIELSNANAVRGMTELVSLTREFEMMTKVIEAFSNIDRKAATDIMKR